MTEAALSTAVLTGAPAGADVRTAALSVTQFRPATLDADKLIAHARIIRKAPTFTYAEAALEDDLGREIARVIGAVLTEPSVPPPPAPVPLGPPLEQPIFPTPDPYLRPLTPAVGIMPREDGEQLDGPGLKSAPEYGLNWSPAMRDRLEPYRLATVAIR